jgi:hypothetical protein
MDCKNCNGRKCIGVCEEMEIMTKKILGEDEYKITSFQDKLDTFNYYLTIKYLAENSISLEFTTKC